MRKANKKISRMYEFFYDDDGDGVLRLALTARKTPPMAARPATEKQAVVELQAAGDSSHGGL